MKKNITAAKILYQRNAHFDPSSPVVWPARDRQQRINEWLNPCDCPEFTYDRFKSWAFIKCGDLECLVGLGPLTIAG